MSHDGIFDAKKHVRTYLVVFVSLAFLTIVTVAVSYLHLSTKPAILVALLIATIKGSLVASYFMHLISEKKLIFMVLLITALFFVFLMSLPISTIEEMTK
ncbi:MAG: cytochrome C oxidase subunit IV family protein [Deltaproteobacteria bacterium]|nr:cytochrome C oxidase subunit IV family protein [Deltaproteobacteria bacterium]MBI4374520.1 cytochrome C oxidase subunit IV family protein [Deltaproteobacteria bacterium]